VRILIGDDYSGVFRDILDDDPLDHEPGCYGREFAVYHELAGISPAQVLAWGTKNAGEMLVDGPARALIRATHPAPFGGVIGAAPGATLLLSGLQSRPMQLA